jgi:hypothetical protein
LKTGNGSAPNKLWKPTDLAIDQEGYLVVCDSWNHRVQVFELDDPEPCPETTTGSTHFLSRIYLFLNSILVLTVIKTTTTITVTITAATPTMTITVATEAATLTTTITAATLTTTITAATGTETATMTITATTSTITVTKSNAVSSHWNRDYRTSVIIAIVVWINTMLY